jgi:hypothetical protein
MRLKARLTNSDRIWGLPFDDPQVTFWQNTVSHSPEDFASPVDFKLIS